MKVRYFDVLVQRGPLEAIETTVSEHEFPVLQEVHRARGDESLQIQGESTREVNLDPDAEWERLKAKYGNHKETRTPFVQVIYGVKAGPGLMKAMGLEARPRVRAPAPRKAAQAAQVLQRSAPAA